MFSSRNKLRGIIKNMTIGQATIEITVSVGEIEVIALISRISARKMGLKVGDQVTVLFKPSELMANNKSTSVIEKISSPSNLKGKLLAAKR